MVCFSPVEYGVLLRFRALALRRSRLCGILPLLTVEVNLLRCVHTSDVNADARAVKTSVNAT